MLMNIEVSPGFIYFFNIYLFIWLHQVLAMAYEI